MKALLVIAILAAAFAPIRLARADDIPLAALNDLIHAIDHSKILASLQSLSRPRPALDACAAAHPELLELRRFVAAKSAQARANEYAGTLHISELRRRSAERRENIETFFKIAQFAAPSTGFAFTLKAQKSIIDSFKDIEFIPTDKPLWKAEPTLEREKIETLHDRYISKRNALVGGGELQIESIDEPAQRQKTEQRQAYELREFDITVARYFESIAMSVTAECVKLEAEVGAKTVVKSPKAGEIAATANSASTLK